MTIVLVAAALTAGYAVGRLRPCRRLSDWAAWQRYGTRPTGLRRAAVRAIATAVDLAWIVAHPRQAAHTWKHRNDPQPGRGPAVAMPVRDPNWVASQQATANTSKED